MDNTRHVPKPHYLSSCNGGASAVLIMVIAGILLGTVGLVLRPYDTAVAIGVSIIMYAGTAYALGTCFPKYGAAVGFYLVSGTIGAVFLTQIISIGKLPWDVVAIIILVDILPRFIPAFVVAVTVAGIMRWRKEH